MANATSPTPQSASTGLVLFFALAFAITWLLDIPLVLATVRQVPLSPVGMLMAGLGAWGPNLAALIVAARHGSLRGVFGRWRTAPIWIAVGLFTLPGLHLPATLAEVALGGQPAHWFYPPVRPELVAALVMFSVGEEFGWRGFAYPRLARRYGPVNGSLILGTLWAVWHLGMWFTPAGPPTLAAFGLGILELTAGSVVVAWVFERGNRSMAVAIALHMGAHLDNTFRAPETEVRLRILRFLVLISAAVLAGVSLAKAARRQEPDAAQA
jgi:membrane protease YdiL (CAAX protease family)